MKNKLFGEYCKDIRKELKHTREDAAALMKYKIEPAKLEKIENFKVQSIAPLDVVRIADAYNRPEICNYYCKNECEIGKRYVRTAELKDLAHMAIDTLNALNQIEREKERFLEIVGDEKITPDEYEDFKQIRKNIEQIARTADSLMVWIEKAELNKEL